MKNNIFKKTKIVSSGCPVITIGTNSLTTTGKLILNTESIIKHLKENPDVLIEINVAFRNDKLNKIKEKINAHD